MTGGHVIAELLRTASDITDLVPADRIKLGRLPEGVELPALLVRNVSAVDRLPLKRGASERRTDRAAVTVRAASYREQVAIIRAVRARCSGQIGDVAGATRASVQPAGKGPDLGGPGNSFEQTADFRVSADFPV